MKEKVHSALKLTYKQSINDKVSKAKYQRQKSPFTHLTMCSSASQSYKLIKFAHKMQIQAQEISK